MVNILQADATDVGVQAETNRFMQRVYGWMAFALVVSGGIAYYASIDIRLYTLIFENGLFMPLLLVEL